MGKMPIGKRYGVMGDLTVADVMKLDIFKNVTIRAGVSGLNYAVTGITTAEDPDLIQWLYGGEILLTSLYGIATDNVTLCDYLKKLTKKRISALIIKNSARLQEIPDKIISIGDSYSLPIIELPPNIRFIDVVSCVMGLILDNKTQYYMKIQNRLAQMATSGSNERDILDYLAKYVPASILLCDSDKNCLYSAESKEFHQDLPVADRITLPIVCMGEVNGYLEVVLNNYLEENMEGILKTAATLLAIFFLKKYYIAEIEQKYISSFLSDLFRGVLDVKQIEKKALYYGWKPGDTFLVAFIHLESEKSTIKLTEALMELVHLIPKEHFYIHIESDCIHLMLHLGKALETHTAYEQMTKTLQKLDCHVTKMYGAIKFHSGISSLANHPRQLPLKIEEAADALQFCKIFHNTIMKFEDMGSLRMLASYSHRDNLEQIISPAIRKLADYDKQNNTQYLDTLDSLLGNNLNLSKTAKELFIHYKTMLHRMDRICNIAEISLEDRQQRLDIELGVKLYMMLPK